MNFLVDVHLPISLSKFLNVQEECTAIHVNQILQKWHTADAEICKYADENNLVVISKDNDFKNSHFISRSPRKVIRISLGNISNIELIKLFEKQLQFILPLATKKHFFVELSAGQVTIIE